MIKKVDEVIIYLVNINFDLERKRLFLFNSQFDSLYITLQCIGVKIGIESGKLYK